ncbi:MAG: choice-of-anchor Q domain-containing protein [Planctomycetota bacterium]
MRVLMLVSAILCASVASAADFYVDPVNGSAGGTGTMGDPWLTLQQVVTDNLIESREWDAYPYTTGSALQPKNSGAPIQAGDTVRLLSGYHGELILNGYYNTSAITIRAEPGNTPELSRVSIIGASNWVLDGLSISPSHATTYVQQTIITMRDDGFWGPADNLTVRNCDVFNVNDASGWSAQDWIDNASTAFDVRSNDSELADNTVRNIRFGISVTGANVHVHGNTVENFSGDGMRGLGDYDVFEYNIIKNGLDVGDGNHDDGFQSWSVGSGGVGTGSVYGLILRGNTIINHENPSHPLRTTLQGIGCFDGWFEDWVIENNVVITDHWHGITLLGAKNCRIVNNTVIDLYTGTPGPSWIQVGHHKTLGPSENCVIRNNLANTISIPSGQVNITEDHNITVSNPSAFFVDPANFDLHLLDTAAAIDAGNATLAPLNDRDQIGRPYNGVVDIGAFEWHPAGWTGPPSGSSNGGGGDDGGGCTNRPGHGAFWLLFLGVIFGLAKSRLNAGLKRGRCT